MTKLSGERATKKHPDDFHHFQPVVKETRRLKKISPKKYCFDTIYKRKEGNQLRVLCLCSHGSTCLWVIMPCSMGVIVSVCVCVCWGGRCAIPIPGSHGVAIGRKGISTWSPEISYRWMKNSRSFFSLKAPKFMLKPRLLF